MITLGPLAVPDAVGGVSTALDLGVLDITSPLTLQLIGSVATDAVKLYGSMLSAITVLAQASQFGTIGVTGDGRSPVAFESFRYRYVYVVRANGTTTGLELTAVGEASTNNAAQIGYAPSNLTNWSGVAPTSVANALDRIAAKITPIP